MIQFNLCRLFVLIHLLLARAIKIIFNICPAKFPHVKPNWFKEPVLVRFALNDNHRKQNWAIIQSCFTCLILFSDLFSWCCCCSIRYLASSAANVCNSNVPNPLPTLSRSIKNHTTADFSNNKCKYFYAKVCTSGTIHHAPKRTKRCWKKHQN